MSNALSKYAKIWHFFSVDYFNGKVCSIVSVPGYQRMILVLNQQTLGLDGIE